MTNNKDLKEVYDEMHTKGPSAWFDDGKLERKAIVGYGFPWDDGNVLEIGCGEGDLLQMIAPFLNDNAKVVGYDYSKVAVRTANEKYPYLDIMHCESMGEFASKCGTYFSTVVMQGVLEHVDNPFDFLDDILYYFNPKEIITSSPYHRNPRGNVWMFAKLVLGAVMSKTDLHEIDEFDIDRYCFTRGARSKHVTIDQNWGSGPKCAEDYATRLPLALKDGNIPYDEEGLTKYLEWLAKGIRCPDGAVAIYKIEAKGSF